ncbi:hypothetical protein HRI_003005300 [Hibiscus trionum]|uniref:EF-hand domain-containing protein n=1 Tax=Hibiscus trionum TaxID=183268 RepID=A0A9W7IBJ5_HIBTR|nr:hypothetical protein HRI_003005300 [Hibiscus trionum]
MVQPPCNFEEREHFQNEAKCRLQQLPRICTFIVVDNPIPYFLPRFCLRKVINTLSLLSILVFSHCNIRPQPQFNTMAAAAAAHDEIVFEDLFPAMVEKLGAEGFMKELCSGFRLLMDGEKGLITVESLKKNLALLGLQGMSDGELVCMVSEGDLNGDGGLDEMEFCTMMFRLSPALMKNSTTLLEEALVTEI